MTTILALDLSKASTGWALWHDGLERPQSGTWRLGSEFTDAGKTFLNLHRQMNDLYSVSPFDIVIYEKPRHLDGFNVQSSADAHFLLVGLAAHVDSFCAAKAARKVRSANQASWRKHFIGNMKRGTKSVDLKQYAMNRCAQLGLKPAKHDEAEAIGILSYMCALEGIQPCWEAHEVLRQPLMGASA